jgi:hypothetical protein
MAAICAAGRELARALDNIYDAIAKVTGGEYEAAQEITVSQLADWLQIHPFYGDQFLEGTIEHRRRIEHYASVFLDASKVLFPGAVKAEPPSVPLPPAPPPCRDHKGRPIFRSEESRG